VRSAAGVWLLAALLLAGCGSRRGIPEAGVPRYPWDADGTQAVIIQDRPLSVAQQMKGQTGVLTLEVSDTGFVPPLIRVAEGSRVKIHLRNTGARYHNLVIPRFGIVAGAIPPGGENYIEFTASEKGAWPFFSDAPGYMETGLLGTLLVE